MGQTSFPGFVMLKSMTKTNQGEKRVYLSMLFQITAHHQGKSRKELKQEPKDKLQRNTAYRLASSLPPSDCVCIQPGNTCLGMVPPTVGWALWHQSKQSPIDMATGQSNLGNYSDEVPSSQYMSGRQYKLTTTDTIPKAILSGDIFLRPVLPFFFYWPLFTGTLTFLGKSRFSTANTVYSSYYSEK